LKRLKMSEEYENLPVYEFEEDLEEQKEGN
jgi:hypothetical protein